MFLYSPGFRRTDADGTQVPLASWGVCRAAKGWESGQAQAEQKPLDTQGFAVPVLRQTVIETKNRLARNSPSALLGELLNYSPARQEPQQCCSLFIQRLYYTSAFIY